MARFSKLEFDHNEDQSQNQEFVLSSRPDASTWLKRADSCRRIGTYEAALQYYSRSLEEDKSQIICWVGQVQMLVQLNEVPEGELWSRKALELFPSNGELLAARAQTLCRLGKINHAQATIDQAMLQSGESAYRWMVRGELLVKQRQGTAKHCFDKAIHCDGDWLTPLESALIYRHYNQPANGLSLARQATDRDPSSPYAWYIMAKCQFDLGMLGPAKKSVKTSLELKRDYQDASLLLDKIDGATGFWKRIRSLWTR